ncbi:unnamed protein product [Ectocarpus sp. 8 AP-2014]
MVEQRGHELVGRPRVVSVSKVLVQSNVYRRSAGRSASQGGRGTECGRATGQLASMWLGRSVGWLVYRWKKHQLRKRKYMDCMHSAGYDVSAFVSSPKALVIVVSSLLSTVRRLPAPASNERTRAGCRTGVR